MFNGRDYNSEIAGLSMIVVMLISGLLRVSGIIGDIGLLIGIGISFVVFGIAYNGPR